MVKEGGRGDVPVASAIDAADRPEGSHKRVLDRGLQHVPTSTIELYPAVKGDTIDFCAVRPIASNHLEVVS